MKYSNKDIIQSGEQKLIRFLARHLDLDAVKASIRGAHYIDVQDNLTHQSGNIVIHKGEIAYRLDFDLKVNLSILLDRNGECLSIQSPQFITPDRPSAENNPEQQRRQAEHAQKASEIAQMMSEINES